MMVIYFLSDNLKNIISALAWILYERFGELELRLHHLSNQDSSPRAISQSVCQSVSVCVCVCFMFYFVDVSQQSAFFTLFFCWWRCVMKNCFDIQSQHSLKSKFSFLFSFMYVCTFILCSYISIVILLYLLFLQNIPLPITII